MLLLDRLGAGGSYTEFYALDFDDEFILMGHDGPGHLAIAEGRPVARALKLYHGKSGAGLSVEMKVRLGPVTILGLTQTADGRLKLIAAEGESIAGPTFRIGNTNSRIRFATGPRGRSSTPGAPRARPITSRSASGISCRGCARSRTCSGSSWPSSARRADEKQLGRGDQGGGCHASGACAGPLSALRRVIDENTRAGLDEGIAVEAQGELPLKGKRQPVKVYAVTVASLVAESA